MTLGTAAMVGAAKDGAYMPLRLDALGEWSQTSVMSTLTSSMRPVTGSVLSPLNDAVAADCAMAPWY